MKIFFTTLLVIASISITLPAFADDDGMTGRVCDPPQSHRLSHEVMYHCEKFGDIYRWKALYTVDKYQKHPERFTPAPPPEEEESTLLAIWRVIKPDDKENEKK